MSEIQQNRYDQLLRRVGGLIGPGSKVSEVITELFPMFDVENVPGELMLLGGTHLGMGSHNAVPVAAQAGKVQLVNPVGSGIIATITTMIISTAGNSTVSWGPTDTLFVSNPGVEVTRDSREGVAGQPVCTINELTSVAINTREGLTRTASSTPFILTDPNGIFVLTSGTALEVAMQVTNLQMIVTYFWRERVAEQSELNF